MSVWLVLLVAVVCLLWAPMAAVGLLPRPVAQWARAAVLIAFGAGAVWLWGVFSMFTLDIGETCARQHPRGWVAEESRETLFPPSSTCNADHDLVAVWVAPALYGLLGAAVGCVVAAVWTGTSRTRGVRRP